jgi:pimeloyl-ACP methyl ester carboxylesterase
MDHLMKAPYSGLVEAMDSGMRYDFTPLLESISVPVLVVHGKKDSGRKPQHVGAFKDGLPNARIVEMECGHYPMEELPEEFEQELIAFLRTLPASRVRVIVS